MYISKDETAPHASYKDSIVELMEQKYGITKEGIHIQTTKREAAFPSMLENEILAGFSFLFLKN